jgi:hypothetical protein
VSPNSAISFPLGLIVDQEREGWVTHNNLTLIEPLESTPPFFIRFFFMQPLGNIYVFSSFSSCIGMTKRNEDVVASSAMVWSLSMLIEYKTIVQNNNLGLAFKKDDDFI